MCEFKKKKKSELSLTNICGHAEDRVTGVEDKVEKLVYTDSKKIIN